MRKESTDKKIAALKKYSTLNPQSQRVRDKLFDQDEFFDARDLVQVKYEMLRKVRENKKTVSEVSADFGFSRPSFYQAKAAFENEGVAGIDPQKAWAEGASQNNLTGPGVCSRAYGKR